MGNKNLAAAKNAKNDEFYTQLTDIEKEMRYYRKHFKGKTVLCNCDDPFESNFFKYFVLYFNKLKLKKLIATCYINSAIAGTKFKISKNEKYKPYKAIVNVVRDANSDGGIDMVDVVDLFNNGENELVELKGDGDFRSEECIEILKEADIVVTNPPFSLFREYVATLMEYNKKFIIIGNINAITYKEIFPLLKENRVWLGTGMGRWISGFIVPPNYELYGTETHINKKGERIVSTNNCLWLTNLEHKKRHEDLILVKKYNPKDYPKYDNYNAINVNKVVDIPRDYKGVMGVPITFMDKYNPDQFELLGCSASFGRPKEWSNNTNMNASVNGSNIYKRLFIRNKHPEAVKGE